MCCCPNRCPCCGAPRVHPGGVAPYQPYPVWPNQPIWIVPTTPWNGFTVTGNTTGGTA